MRAVLVALLLAGAVLLAGCGEQVADGSTSSGTSDAAGAGGEGGEGGEGAAADLDFSGTTLTGETFEGTSLEGKPAVLWFWAPWCPTCRGQIDAVTDLAEKYDGEVSVIAVGGLDEEAAIRDLAREIPHVTHVVDVEGAVWRHFGVTEQSTYEVIDADGDVVSEGYLDDAALAAKVEQIAG